MVFIILFILILNIVSIALMYYCLGKEIENKEKLVFIAAGTAIMYLLTLLVYWISTRNIEISEVSQTGKDLITFLFVPVNGILVLPLFAKSYSKFKNGIIKGNILRNRGIVLGVFLLIVLIIECFYFASIQEQVVKLIRENNQNQNMQGVILDGNSLNSNEIDGNSADENSANVLDENDGNEISTNNINENNIDEDILSNNEVSEEDDDSNQNALVMTNEIQW